MMRFVTLALLASMATMTASAHSVDHNVEHQVATQAPEFGGKFSLVSQEGKPFTDEDLKGSPTAIFFGFTSCPDLCPTTLYELVELRKKLGPNARRLKVVMVTVDPTNDTPEVLRDYLSYFDPTFTGLTGSEKDIKQVSDLYHVTNRKDNGEITHSASVYLLDAEGNFKSAISYQEDPLKALRKLNDLFDAPQ